MKLDYSWMFAIVAILVLSHRAFADCIVTEESKQLDPLEVGFCESDAVFIGKSEGAIETIGGVTPEGSTTTKHFRIQRSTVRVLERHKGALPDKVTMIADLYAKERPAFVFEAGKTYLIFAKRLAGENEYVGAGACSLQPTLSIEAAGKLLKQLEQHKTGRNKIDCQSIRAKKEE